MTNTALQLPMREIDHFSLVDAVRAEMKVGEITQSTVAKEADIGVTVLNQWLQGKYPGDVEAVNSKMETWLVSRKKRRELSEQLPRIPGWTETPTSRRILAALSYAQMAGDISVIYGSAGLGKTVSMRHYAAKNPAVWYATVTPASSSLAACLDQIVHAVGLKLGHCSPAKLEAALIDRLQNTNGLLIIDEAQHLPVKSLEAIRSIHDATGVGLAIAGNEVVYARLTGGSRSAEFAQLFSRIGKKVKLTKPLRGDVEALAAAWNIDDKQVIEELFDYASRPGALRSVTKALRLAPHMAKNGAVTLDVIRAAWKDLGGDA